MAFSVGGVRGEDEVEGRLPFAGALRVIATALIVVHHAWISTVNVKSATGSQFLVTFSHMGVAFFFALSGFLLSRPYIEAFRTNRPLPSWRRYARDRSLRIYPLYAFCTLLFAALPNTFAVPGQRVAGPADVISHLTFTFLRSKQTALTIDPVMWTMATDVQFYLAVPVLFAAIFSFRHIWPEQRVSVIAIPVALLCLASILWRLANGGHTDDSIASFELRVIRFGQLPGTFCTFGGGILWALAWVQTPRNCRIWLGLTALSIAAYFAYLSLGGWLAGRYEDVVLDDVWWSISAPAIIVAGSALIPARWVDWPAIRLAEALSYALYLTHFFALVWVGRYAAGLETRSFFVVMAIGVYGAGVLMALPLHYFVERPFLMLKATLRRHEATS